MLEFLQLNYDQPNDEWTGHGYRTGILTIQNDTETISSKIKFLRPKNFISYSFAFQHTDILKHEKVQQK
jgi:hypothetical protein